MIEIKNLSFAYKGNEVLKNVNLTLKKGFFYGIIGPNGSGKSTLLKLASGNLKPLSGEILIEGKPIGDYGALSLAKKLSFMPQSIHKPDMTTFDFVACGRFPHKTMGSRLNSDDIDIITSSLKATQTEAFGDRCVKTLSGGEFQRVLFAQLLAQCSDHILCDEPTTFLDLSAEKNTLNFLKNQVESKCVVAVLHNISMALKYCDYIIVMDEGTLYDFGRPEDIIKNKTIEKVFDVSCHRTLIEGEECFFFI